MHAGLIRRRSWPLVAFLLVPALISCEGGPQAIAGAESVEDAAHARTGEAERAEAVIDRAGGLLARARTAVGDDPPAAVRRGLREARSRLALARRAFEAGRYREAIRWAFASARLSRRILSWAADDGLRTGRAG